MGMLYFVQDFEEEGEEGAASPESTVKPPNHQPPDNAPSGVKCMAVES